MKVGSVVECMWFRGVVEWESRWYFYSFVNGGYGKV